MLLFYTYQLEGENVLDDWEQDVKGDEHTADECF